MKTNNQRSLREKVGKPIVSSTPEILRSLCSLRMTMKRILKDEAGQALAMALIMLVLGGLLVVPMLSLMTTSLNANRIIDVKTSATYAADSGIQDALWKLGDGVDLFAGGDSYDLAENVNGMTVTVEKQALEGDLYTLRSTARLNGEVKTVIIAQAVAGSADFSWLFEHAITSSGSITTKKSDVIYGGLLYEGTYDGNADVRTGLVEQGTVTFPTEEYLKDYYLGTFDDTVCADPANYCPDNPYPYSSYSIPSGATESNPHMIPWLYRQGNLTITGSGYGKLSGTIYLTGNFSTSPGITIDLNGNTIFAEGDINFQPNSTIYGPGCIIAVGNVNYQPNLGTGEQLIGEDFDTEANTTLQDKFALYKFKATACGTLSSFQVKCYISDPEAPEAHIKVAVYDDDGTGGAPKTLLGAVDYADNITVLSSWNPITFPEITITKNNYYWLAAISDYPVISKKTVSSTELSRYKSQAFTGFEFPNDISTVTFIKPNTEQYMLRGFTNSQEFIFIMAVNGSTNLQPGASFYGSIAGNTNVNLQPNCTINLVDFDDGELEFPGISGSSSGPGTGGNSPPLLNYKIQ